MNNKPTYFEMPNFDTPPDTSVRLGQIIHNFKDPTGVVAPPPASNTLQHIPDIYTGVQRDWRLNRTNFLNGSFGLYTHFLATILGIGADVSLLREREYEDLFQFDTLETYFFDPDLDYIRAAMASSQVARFYKEHRYQPAYIVTGLKIARGATIQRVRRLQHGAEGSAGVDITAVTAVPATIGPTGSVQTGQSQSTSFTGSTDFVFAYRLKKISFGKKQTVSGSKDYVRGAVHNLDDEEASARGVMPKPAEDNQFALDDIELAPKDFGGVLVYSNFSVVDVDEPDDEAAQIIVKSSS